MEKIISLGSDELGEWDLERLEKLEFDLMVYAYKNGGYDGSGFAAFKKGEQWFYQELGHCSCNGPLENIETSSNMLVSLEQVINLATSSYGDGAELVAQYLKDEFTTEGWHALVSDNDGHEYVIPLDKVDEFYAWVESTCDDDSEDNEPAWAVRKEGTFQFKQYKV